MEINTDYKPVNLYSEDENLFITGEQIGINVLIPIQNQKIKMFIYHASTIDKDDQKKLYNKIYSTVRNVDHVSLCKAQDTGEDKYVKLWEEFCFDIVMIYALRLFLFDKQIPVIHPDMIKIKNAPKNECSSFIT